MGDDQSFGKFLMLKRRNGKGFVEFAAKGTDLFMR